MSDFLTVRPAHLDELEEVGRLTLEAYLTDGMVNPAGSYAAQLADASRRASDAELLVAVDPEGMLLGTITVCTPGSPLGELSRRLYARLGFIRMPERDWYPLPGVRFLAFGATTAASGPP